MLRELDSVVKISKKIALLTHGHLQNDDLELQRNSVHIMYRVLSQLRVDWSVHEPWVT